MKRALCDYCWKPIIRSKTRVWTHAHTGERNCIPGWARHVARPGARDVAPR